MKNSGARDETPPVHGKKYSGARQQ